MTEILPPGISQNNIIARVRHGNSNANIRNFLGHAAAGAASARRSRKARKTRKARKSRRNSQRVRV